MCYTQIFYRALTEYGHAKETIVRPLNFLFFSFRNKINKKINNGLEVAHPQSGSSST